jgi:hypothetical protein
MDEKDSRSPNGQYQPSADATNHSSDTTDHVKTYPPKKVVLPTMVALFLVFFLVALVDHLLPLELALTNI